MAGYVQSQGLRRRGRRHVDAAPSARVEAARARIRAQAAELDLRRILHRHPAEALAVAAGLGAFVGFSPKATRTLVRCAAKVLSACPELLRR